MEIRPLRPEDLSDVQDFLVSIDGERVLSEAKRRRLGKVIDSFLELREGDLVVHLSHGIGRYRGLKLLDKEGRIEEHLKVEFHGGTKVYVPASKIALVQKYVGGARSRPSLARIGGKSKRDLVDAARGMGRSQSDAMEAGLDSLRLLLEGGARPPTLP